MWPRLIQGGAGYFGLEGTATEGVSRYFEASSIAPRVLSLVVQRELVKLIARSRGHIKDLAQPYVGPNLNPSRLQISIQR